MAITVIVVVTIRIVVVNGMLIKWDLSPQQFWFVEVILTNRFVEETNSFFP